ncbi:uncharacterized protein ARMOST_20376 [Armillaria ostoyae]|uniref:Uncharacterized protein n=1 Tax=Armillaria ostoyae TaxID=47428 RepID=A0A284S750_ARMOS|nr:uncharacterized protein ARMOST_20376 [Armillaria ostoyae]
MCQKFSRNAIDCLQVSHHRTPRFIVHLHFSCLPAPSTPGPHFGTERIDVSWCLKRGTRIIPEGTIKGAYFVQMPDFLQVTSVGDFTQLNNHSDDAGGELDRNCSDLARNPLGDFIYSSTFGMDMQD